MSFFIHLHLTATMFFQEVLDGLEPGLCSVYCSLS